MRLVEVVPVGPLAQKYKPIIIGAETAAEAIEGWSRQSVTDGARLHLVAVDFDTEDKLNAPITVDRIELLPEMVGGGGFGRILMGAVLIGLSFIPGIGQALQGALIATGIGMAVGGVLSLFMKAPSLSKEADPPASHYLGGAKNTTQIGTIIGFGAGTMLVGGQILSLQVNSSDLVYGTFP